MIIAPACGTATAGGAYSIQAYSGLRMIDYMTCLRSDSLSIVFHRLLCKMRMASASCAVWFCDCVSK